jgi:hypothetical protein
MEEWISTWIIRLKAERAARNLPPRQYDALIGMATFLERVGRWPSDDEIAIEAGCSPATAYRARKRAQALEMLEWEHTRQMIAGEWRQGRNAYRASVPETPVAPRHFPGRQTARASRSKKASGLNKTVRQQIAMLPTVSGDLLAASRSRIYQQQAAQALRR